MTKDEWARIVYFEPGEFDSKDAPGSGYAAMQWPLVSKLDSLRADLGHAIIIESGYRTPDHNAAVGGVKDSEHQTGEGADIRTAAMANGGNFNAALDLYFACVRHGFDRVGLDLKGKFVHVGVSKVLPTPATWYYNGTPAQVV